MLSDVRPSKVSLLIVIPVVSLCLLFSYLFHLHSNLTKAEKYVFADFCTRATATFQRFTPFACFSAWHLFATCLCSLKSLATKRFVPNRHVVKKVCAKQARRQKLLLLRPLKIVRCSSHQPWRGIAQRKTVATHYDARRTCCHLQARLGAAISVPLSSKLSSFSDWAQTAAAAEHPARQQS